MIQKTASQYFKERFGCKVYKLSLNGGMTCPNRDGTLGNRGCIFCSAAGSGDFAAPQCHSVATQLEAAKARVTPKVKDGKYIAYFQAFTNTYAPVKVLKKLFYDAIAPGEVVALSVATRPDCLGDEVVALLAQINTLKPVFVELGLQTVNEATARYIRRGFTNDVFDDGVKKLTAAGLEVIAHQIIGLPGDTPEDAVATARHIGASGAKGIKFHLLHILRGTDLEKEYNKGLVPLPSLEEYTEILKSCIAALPPDTVIHRLTGDGAKRDLIAPLWSADKKRVLNFIKKELDIC